MNVQTITTAPYAPVQSSPAAVVMLADGTPAYALAHTQPSVVMLPAAPAAMPAPVTAAPVRDPWPARLIAGGIGTGAAGLGLGFALQALAAATTGLALLLGVLVLVGFLRHGGGRGAVNVNVRVANHNH